MSEHKSDTSWWQTMPGVLTGIAAVITALGGMIAVVYQSGLLSRQVLNPPPARPRVADRRAVEDAHPHSGELGQIRVGHYAFKLLRTKLESYSTDANGNPQKLSLRLSIRVTDVMGVSDYVDRSTVRLSVDGTVLIPENSINLAVYDRQSVETEAVFIVPADASVIALLLGRPENGVGKLPLTLDLRASR